MDYDSEDIVAADVEHNHERPIFKINKSRRYCLVNKKRIAASCERPTTD